MNLRFSIRLTAAALCLYGSLQSNIHAIRPAERPPLLEIDRRERGAKPPVNPAAPSASVLNERAQDVDVQWDEITGSPRAISPRRGFLTGPNGEGGTVSVAGARAIGQDDPLRPVKTFVSEHRALFGHGPEALEGAEISKDYTDAHNGLRTIAWQQRVKGIRVHEALLKAHVTKRGELVNIGSGWQTNAGEAEARGNPQHDRLIDKPAVSAAAALLIAGDSVGDVVELKDIKETSPPAGFERRQRFEAPGLADACAEYVWLPMGQQKLRLCWQTVFMSRARSEMYLALVDAENGEILVRRSLTEHISDATYNVFTSDSPSPFSPGHQTPSSNQPAIVPRTLVTTPALNTTASPNGWIDDGVNETRGNNVAAHADVNADNLPDLPRPQGATGRVFNPPLDLSLAPSASRDAAVVDLFYWCNRIHDRYYELGFTEAAGNFQLNNFGRGGVGNDAVQADAQDGSGTNNANFSTPPDGSAGRMQMYVFTGPAPDRDGTFDHEIVIHEYTHGLSNRLVGGGVGLSATVSRGMGEGWSDFYGLCLLSEPGDNPRATYAAGGYATYLHSAGTQNYYFGIRRYPYAADLSKNPLTFKDIDPVQASGHPGVPRNPGVGTTANQVHNMGEVWCVTLWEARANLVEKLGFAVGNDLILQLVTDGMKLAPANPNFLQARDAIIQAELVLTGGAHRGELWTAFAKRGMGARATAPSSSTTAGLVENFDIPDDLQITPFGTTKVAGTIGGPFAATNFTVSNMGTAAVAWTASSNQPWLQLDATSGNLPPSASVTVTATPAVAAQALNSGTYNATLTFTNTVSGMTQTRTLTLEVEPFRRDLLLEDFESGTLDPARWTISGTNTFRTQNTPINGPHGGIRHLLMDSTSSEVYARNEATLTVNLAGRTNVELTFWAKGFSDEPNGPPGNPFTGGADFDGVAISADGNSWYEVQPLRSLSGTWTQFSVDLDAAIATAGIGYTPTFKIRFNQYDNYPVSTDGIAIDDVRISETFENRLAVTLPAEIDENAAPVAGTVSATPVPATDLIVNLLSSAPGTLAVPATVTIPAGQTSVPFTATCINDTVLNGSRKLDVAATTVGWGGHTTAVTVHDNEIANLGVSIPATANEGTGVLGGSVTISVAPATEIAVSLISSDTTELTLPESVIIPAGQTSAAFSATVVDDNRIDGAVATTVTARVENWTPGNTTVTVQDNEVKNLTVALPAGAREGDGTVIGAVQISGTLSSPLTVALVSSDSSELVVPPSVTIPAGQTVASFTATVVNDADSDGSQTATLTATAAGFTDGDGIITVQDNDAHHFTVSSIPAAKTPNVPFTVTVTARDLNGLAIPGFNSPVSLRADAGGTAVGCTPATLAPWVNGIWTGTVTVTAEGSSVILTVDDGQGHTGSSNTFDVAVGALHHFAWDPITSPKNQDDFFNVRVVAQDVGNNPVTSFNGTANLTVEQPGTVQILSWVGFADLAVGGEYDNTKRAISTYFTNFVETSTTVTGPAELQAALAGKHVFLIPEQENAGSMATLATSWASVLADFANRGGIIIVCSWQKDEHLLLVNSSLMTATKGAIPVSSSLTKTADTPLNASVATPFNGSYISEYTGSNGEASLVTTTSGNPAVLSRTVGSGQVILIGTDFYTLGTGMDRVIANAVQLAGGAGADGIPVNPPITGSFVNGVWVGDVAVPFAGNGLRLLAEDAAGNSGLSNSFNVQSPAPPSNPASTVLNEPFESPTLGSWWTTTGTGPYRTQLSSSNVPHGGLQHLAMDSTTSGAFARNEATLTVNLAGRTGVVLTFWAKGFGEEPNGPPPVPFPNGFDFDGVAISANGGATWYEIQALRTLGAAYTQYTVNLDAAIASHGLSYNSNFKIRFNQYDDFPIPTDGVTIDDIVITATSVTTTTVTLPVQASEGATGLHGTVTLASPATGDITIALGSSATAKITVPATVVVPTGQSSANFPLTIVDNGLLDGNRSVSVTATRAGEAAAVAAITVIDNDITTLTIAAPASIVEGSAGAVATLTLGATPAGPVTFALNSSDPTEIAVPATATFAPGKTIVSIPLSVPDDTEIDGPQSVTIGATAPGWNGVNATVQVTDNESSTLALNFEGSTSEGSPPLSGTVTIPGTASNPLTVSLISNDTSEATVPASVTIPAGQSSVDFSITIVDDPDRDGTQSVTITASAPGFTGSTRNLSVLDNDLHHFSFAPITGSKTLNAPFSVTITARDVNDLLISSFTGTAALSATGASGPVPITPPATGTFVAGSWTGNITCTALGTNVRLNATNAAATGTSTPFDVVQAPAISVSPLSTSVTLDQGTTATRTMRIANPGGATLTWSLSIGTSYSEVVANSPQFTGNSVVSEDKNEAVAPDPAEEPGTIYQQARWEETIEPSFSSVPLQSILDRLNEDHAEVSAVIPARYAFDEGVTGSAINDGGADMYDGGNILGTNLGPSLAYSDNLITSNVALGSAGRYFTRKFDGLWVFAADVAGLNYFEITGNLGADGGGSTDSTVLAVQRGGVTYRGFVKRVYNAGDPSVNHLIIAADNGSMTHEASTDTNNDYHRLTNLTGVTRIYYLLYAGSSGALIDNTATLNIMTKFLDVLSTSDWLAATPVSGSVPAGGSQDVTLTFSAGALPAGTVNTTISISSNDPLLPQTTAQASMTVVGAPMLSVSPIGGFTAVGLRAGPFTPQTEAFTVTNTGSAPMAWTVSETLPWVDVSQESGTLNPGASVVVQATLNNVAATLASGAHTGSLNFNNTTNGAGNATRPVSLTVNPVGELDVTPGDDLSASGPYGGPFAPESKIYTLTNRGDAPLNWAASTPAKWIQLAPLGGTLPAGGTANVTATVVAADLEPRNYGEMLSFQNLSSDRGDTNRSAILTVTLGIPLPAPEPATTAGPSNTVSWNPVVGAHVYEVQCSPEPNFASFISSGSIAATSFTFSGLRDAQTYYYRIRARRNVPDDVSAWSQTTAAEFSTGTHNGTQVTGAGDVTLKSSGSTRTEAFDQAGNDWTSTLFSNITSGIPSYFGRDALSAGSGAPNTTPSLPIGIGGDLEGRFLPGGTGNGRAIMPSDTNTIMQDGSIEGYISLGYLSTFGTQTASFILRSSSTGLNYYSATIGRASPTTGSIYLSKWINGIGSTLTSATFAANFANENYKLRFTAQGATLTASVWRVAVVGGMVTETPITIGPGGNSISASDAGYTSGVAGIYTFCAAPNSLMFDDITVSNTAGNHNATGTFVSPPVLPTQRMRWERIIFTKDTTLGGTALTVDVLDHSGALLAGNVSSGTDLDSIPAVRAAGALRLRANLSTTNPANSPALRDWSIGWYSGPDTIVESGFSGSVFSTQLDGAPTISSIQNQTIMEDTSAGPLALAIADDVTTASNLTVQVFSTNPSLIPAGNVKWGGVETNRTIRITPVANQHGHATLSIVVVDESGKMAESSFEFTVLPVNDAPGFASEGNMQTLEDAGLLSFPDWAKLIVPGPADEAGQGLQFEVANDNPSLFAVPPAVTSSGQLTFRTGADLSGTANVTVRLRDNGGAANGGSDTSEPTTFVITVVPVNDAPTFVKGSDVSVPPGSVGHTIEAWAKTIRSGPSDESGQTLEFQVGVDTPEMFSVTPSITAGGTLSFTPREGERGIANITVRLKDDGGTANGGVDQSPPQTFKIAITSVSDEAGRYNGLISTAVGLAPRVESVGLLKLTLSRNRQFTGKLTLGHTEYRFTGSFNREGVARFGQNSRPSFALERPNLPPLSATFHFDVAQEEYVIFGEIKDGDDALATIRADRALYTSAAKPVAPKRNVPPGIPGRYTVAFVAKSPEEQGLAAARFPQGDGVGVLRVGKDGMVRLTATLANGDKVTYANSLSINNVWPFYHAREEQSTITGPIHFRDQPDVSDADGLNLMWFHPGSRDGMYPRGWSEGIRTDLIGSKYLRPTRGNLVIPDLSPSTSNANAMLILTDGGLDAAGIEQGLQIRPSHLVRAMPANPALTSVTIDPATGYFRGSFRHPATNRQAMIRGAFLQKQKIGVGSFRLPEEVGGVSIRPNPVEN